MKTYRAMVNILGLHVGQEFASSDPFYVPFEAKGYLKVIAETPVAAPEPAPASPAPVAAPVPTPEPPAPEIAVSDVSMAEEEPKPKAPAAKKAAARKPGPPEAPLMASVSRGSGFASVIESATRKALTKGGLQVQNGARRRAPVDQGTLRRSITFTVDGDTCRVGSNLDYALGVEKGTGIYGDRGRPITPTSGKFLRFTVGGQVVFARSVRGRRATPYLAPALNDLDMSA